MFLLLAALLAVEAPVGERDVRAAVDHWLAAQNAGDFAAYEKLYASRFTGVRRSGPRTARFDRAGWMRDRARMFAKPMTVGAADVKVHAAGSVALVTFTQTFSQGTFKDAGPKQLVFVRDAGALKISTERMLRSSLLSASVPKDDRFRYVVSGALLLSSEPDEAWATGPIKYDRKALEEKELKVAERRADPAKLPPEILRWRDRPLRLIDAAGGTCEAKVRGFKILSRAVPHFGTVQEWAEMKESEVGKQAWELGQKVLVGDLDRPCPGARWAQPAALPAAASNGGEDLDAALRKHALAEVRRSSHWQYLQSLYRDEGVKGVKHWDELKERPLKMRLFRAKVAGRDVRLVSVTGAYWQEGGCDAAGDDLWLLYEDRDGKLVRRNTDEHKVQPIAAIDSDGDGNSELLFEPLPTSYTTEVGRLLLDGDKWDTIEVVEYPFMDCPC